ncbi:hypothetical protein [Roseburia sp. 499]|uniref:hypothetical protein n=1 Tax=Roseburia sp. 499 TaxID=1261634 RepID=UPI0013010DD1|nr:hypothetical protein [Roseburia sp. 499]WVK69390.1 hypothetical protein BIV20_13645 [Roseburia sp. 499]
MKENDFQRNSYLLTINNPLDHGYDHKKISEILISQFTTLQFFAMADEMGKTLHTHIYVCFSSRVRFSKIKKAFPEAHIDVAKGGVESNINYIKKEGKWAETEKAETSIEGSYMEWGIRPAQRGTKQDMQELYEMVKNGYSNAEILAINNDYILHIDKIDKVRTMLLQEKYKNERRTNLRVIYISGATGTGKTRGVLDAHGDANVYRVSDYQHPFDGYSMQSVMVFDEFRSGLKLSDMLNYCDIYPIELPARYVNKYACFDTVYIISNWELEEQYKEVQKDNPESWKAFLRRIHEVRIYAKNGTITIYNSVEKYLHRNEKFRTLSTAEQTELPF